MKNEFDPTAFGSYEQLPTAEMQNFEALEGGKGFVLKTAEKDPKVAHRLAIMEDGAINDLRNAMETQEMSFDDLLSRYRISFEKYNYKERGEASELLKQMSDLKILRGENYDPALEAEFKKRYDTLTYSDKLQSFLAKEVDTTDLSVIAKLLLDDKFSSKYKLLEKVGDDESLRKLFEFTKSNLSVAKVIVRKMQSSESRIGVLKEIVDSINGETDEKVKAKQEGNYSLKTIREEVLRSLVSGGNIEQTLSLIDEGYLDVPDAKSLIHEIPTDDLLLSFASRCRDKKSATYIFKFIADKTVFAKIVESHGEEFKNLSESDKADVVALAERFGEVLINQPEVYRADGLKETNKFIVGVPSDENKLFISWSNTESHEYHKDIFETLSRMRGKKFPESLRSGGYVEIQDEKDGKRKVVFSRSSGDFGNYGNRLLGLYKEAILGELKKEFGEHIELQIEVSR